MLFEKQYRFQGKHAMMVNALTAVFDEASKACLFERNVDVYILAPLVGFLYKRKGVKDREDKDSTNQNIFPEQMIRYSDKLKYNLRLILLLDEQNEPDANKRIDLAFRYLEQHQDQNQGRNSEQDEKALALFDSYVLGGVEVLYEKLVEGDSSPSEFLNRMFDFTEEFHERFNESITSDTILTLCSQAQK